MRTKYFPNIHLWANDELEKAFHYFHKEMADETNSEELASLREKLLEIAEEQSRRGMSQQARK